ncbi:uncharacterized protein NECHADRAFT_21495, partial [Fusarium vanettenii 77-13-4]
RRPCRFYIKGYCKNGDTCTLLHEKPKEADGEEGSKENNKARDFIRELGGTWVRFGPGATATEIILPSDFSAVRISNLPTGYSTQLIEDMLWRAGLNISRCDIYVSNAKKGTAMVRIWSPSFPKEAWGYLGTRNPKLGVVPIPVPFPVGSNLRRVDCRQVQFTWYRPSREVNLIFGTREAALRLYQGVPAGLTVHGYRVTAHPPALGDDLVTWVVRLTGLPESVRDQDVIQIIPKRYWPFQNQIRYLVYTDDTETESTFVRSMLDEYGPLERWEVSEISEGGQIKGQAVFFEEFHARNAATALDGRRLPFSKSRRLSTTVVTVVKFDVLPRVYDVVQGQIDAHKRFWEDQNIEFDVLPPRGSFSILQLKGSDRESMAKAKNELELVLAGEVMRQHGKNIWHPSFNNRGEAYETLKTIEEELGIAIVRDGWLSQFRVFGAGGRQALVAKALDRLIKDTSPPHARASGDSLKPKQYCQICFWVAEEPVMTSCNHAYCDHCFVGMCEAMATNPGEFCITCEGDAGKCRKVFELAEICSLLPSETFDSILEESFTSFVQRHQDQFRYCPTPDCSQVYRAASQTEQEPPAFTCNSCLASICTACHAAHPALTCSEHRNHASGGLQALNKLKKQLGVQDCPRCQTSLEKIAGCDHIICQGCRTHICWVCMAAFDNGDACYQHLMTVHKG